MTSERACRRCGCTEQDCRACVTRTGMACHWVEPDLCSACCDIELPREMTPAIAEVLGLMNFRSCPVAHVFRQGGADIARKCEAEQAFVLWRFLHLAILHGDQWRRYASEDISAAVARAGRKAGLPA